MKKIKVSLDVDGVLLNFMQTISNFIEIHYELKPLFRDAITQYNFRFEESTIHLIGFDNMKKEFEKAGHWKKLQAMPDIELIHDLLMNPVFDITFVTSLPVHLASDRQYNLSTIFNTHIPLDTIHCIPLGQSKKPYIKKIEPDFFIEDNLHNLIDCKGSHKSVWINLKEPNYYDKHNHKEHEIHVVHTFNEAATILLEYAKEHNFNEQSNITKKIIKK